MKEIQVIVTVPIDSGGELSYAKSREAALQIVNSAIELGKKHGLTHSFREVKNTQIRSVVSPPLTKEELYWDRCGCEPTDPIEVLKEKMLWGPYGALPAEYGWTKLKDCSTRELWDHYSEYHKYPQFQILPKLIKVILLLLEERGEWVPKPMVH
jgi:hypothetical protein